MNYSLKEIAAVAQRIIWNHPEYLKYKKDLKEWRQNKASHDEDAYYMRARGYTFTPFGEKMPHEPAIIIEEEEN